MLQLSTPPMWFTLLSGGLCLLSLATTIVILCDAIHYARHDSIKARMHRLADRQRGRPRK